MGFFVMGIFDLYLSFALRGVDGILTVPDGVMVLLVSAFYDLNLLEASL